MPSDHTLWNEALFEAAREIGSPETPAQLTQRGVRRVRYVSRENMTALLDKAVERALRKRGLSEEEVSDLVDNMQAGLLDLLRGAKEVESVRAAMADQRRALAGDVDAAAHEVVPAREFSSPLPSSPRPVDFDRAIRERDMEIDRLERRVAKLSAAFEEAERAFQRALATQHLDAGIQSLYRVVQGLSADAPHLVQKRALMQEIFRANLDLHAKFEP